MTKRSVPVDGTEIVRLAIEWAKQCKLYNTTLRTQGFASPFRMYEAETALYDAVLTRLEVNAS